VLITKIPTAVVTDSSKVIILLTGPDLLWGPGLLTWWSPPVMFLIEYNSNKINVNQCNHWAREFEIVNPVGKGRKSLPTYIKP
jgi:hypothetical protein